MTNPLNYVIALSELINRRESQKIVVKDLLLIVVVFIVFFLLASILDFDIPDFIFFIVGTVLFILTLILFKWILVTLTKLFNINSFYSWDLNNFQSDWIFQGILSKNDEEECLTLTDSDAGCILANKEWKNFSMTFNFKLHHESGFGLIFHANNIDHYLMFKIQNDQAIMPHYRNKDGWQILTQGIGKQLDLENGKWYECSFEVQAKSVLLTVNGHTIQFYISNFLILNHITNNPNLLDNPFMIPVTSTSGSVGFRAHSKEKVSFKNVEVKKK